MLQCFISISISYPRRTGISKPDKASAILAVIPAAILAFQSLDHVAPFISVDKAIPVPVHAKERLVQDVKGLVMLHLTTKRRVTRGGGKKNTLTYFDHDIP